MTKDEFNDYVNDAIHDVCFKGLPATAILMIQEAAKVYRDAEIQRCTEVTPEMFAEQFDNVAAHEPFAKEGAANITAALRERANSNP